ncbi:MAG: condensation domain-containing protein, partial [Thermoleophilaceae bacterium]
MQARDPELLCISARSENALRALAGRYARFLVEESQLPLADVCFTAGARRADHGHRLALVGADGPELAAALEVHAEAGRDERADDPRGVGFLCSAAPGYPGLGRRLLETEVEFGRGLTRLDDELGKPVARSVMRSIAAGKRPDDAGLLCIELALAHLWRSLGVEVADVAGAGVGGLAAGCLSGRLGLREAFSMLDDPADAEPAAEEWSLTVELGARSQRNGSVRVVGSLSAERDERVAFLEAAGALWETGESIDLARLFPAGARVVSLPHTPWERRRLPSVRGVAPVNGRPAPEPARKQPATAREALEPGELASKIRALVARALGLDAGELDDCAGLSELGLDSLMAMELQEAAARELGIELPVEALVESASIEELATLAREVEEDLPRLVPEPGAADQPFPLTPIQYAYWVGRTSAYELGGVSCHLHVELDCVGLDVGRLAGAVDGVVARHPMLRAVVDDDGSQRVLDGIAGYEPVVVDLRGHDDVEVELRRLRAQWSHEVRPAREWPLFEFRVVWVDDGRARLFVSLDLLLADGASLFRLGRELCALYADPAAELEPVGVSFRDYVLAERELRGGSRWRRDWEYWSSRLDELPAAPELPLARDVSDVREPRFERRSVVLDGDRWARLRERAAGMGLTASGLLCAGFAEVLGRFSGGGPFTLNLTSYSRLPVHEDVGRVIGDFTSLTLLEVDGEGERFADRARRLQAQLWRDLEHRRVNGVEVLRELARRRGRREAAMPVVFTSTLGLEHEGSGFPL